MGYSADGESEGAIISRDSQDKLAQQVSCETVSPSDEKDVNCGFILAHIDGPQSDKDDQASQSTVLSQLEEETKRSDMLSSQDGTEDIDNTRLQGAESEFGTRTLSAHASPSSNRYILSHASIAIDDPNANSENLWRNTSYLGDEEEFEETQVYDVYEPLPQSEEDLTDVDVDAWRYKTVFQDDIISSPVREHWTLDSMHVEDSGHHTTTTDLLQMGMEQRDDIQLCERNKDSDYVLYQSTPSPIHSLHASQQLPDNTNYEEVSDSEETYDYAAYLVGSQCSLNTTDNAQDILSETDSPKRSPAVIQPNFPIAD
ncbi:unnamed protein product [Umbelopsis ramanniana]